MAPQASDLLAANFMHLMDEIGNADKFNMNLQDEILGQMTAVNKGMVWFGSKE
jgi:NAD/NADP transhydrogenase alpha subunit